MPSFFEDNADLQFYFERGIDWEPLVRITEADFKAPGAPEGVSDALDFYRDIAKMVGEFVAEQIDPYTAEIDEQGVRFENGEAIFPERLQGIFDQIRELELHGMCLPRDLDGLNVPMLVYWMNAEMIARADVSVMAHHGFHGGIAMAMLIYSLKEGTTDWDRTQLKLHHTRFEKEIREIASGKAWGSMDITEPDAGSDMAKLKAVGEQDENGNWFVTGQKIFITSGHGKYHFVIARTEKPADEDDPFAGLGGMSMFLVKAYDEDEQGNRKRIVTMDRIEEKLGHHGSATASLSYDRAPAQLIGKRGEGFKYMLTLMNNARVAVGFECLGLCESAYRVSKAYAAERKSMGKTIDRHELVADMLDRMETEILGLRALAVNACYAEEMAQKEGIFGTEEASKAWARKARRLTPLLKYMASENAVDFGRMAIQIHGGNGYIREYPAEKLLRDALVMPIYEGTSQIQALMAMKDSLMGIIKNPQDFVRRVAEARWRSLSRDSLERRVAKIQLASMGVQQSLMARTAGDKFKSLRDKPVTEWPTEFVKNWDPKRDFAYAMLHAEHLIRILIDEAVCEVLLDQVRKFPERREVLERYLERAEPRVRHNQDLIATSGGRLLASLAEREQAAERRAAE